MDNGASYGINFESIDGGTLMAGIEQRLDELEERITKSSFRQTKGKANEVNYWVFDLSLIHI